MEIGIIGLPQSGKTTVFNALSRGKADVSHSFATSVKPNLGVAKVPDPRLSTLGDIFHPQKMVSAEVRYIDFPGTPEGLAHTQGISGEFLNSLERTDALLHVVRAFQDPSIPHVEGSVDPQRDVATMEMELAFADLAILERRVERLEAELKGTRASERDAKMREHVLLDRIKGALEREVPIREQELSPEEDKLLGNFQFLTAKPLMIVWNVGEEDLPQSKEQETTLRNQYSRPGAEVAVLCGKLEMELSHLEGAEESEFRHEMGLEESGLDRMIRFSYGLLGLISFFTAGPDEAKAWTVPRDIAAMQAAGKIHSDLERGFIRAEVISFDDLVRCGSFSEGRKKGLLRSEGKTYRVQDGDVITFLFNV